MGQSVPDFDRSFYQGTAAASGGSFSADYPVPPDKVVRLVAVAMLSAATTGHLSAGGSLRAEYVVKNDNGTVSAPSAVSGSTNPLISTATGEASAHVQAADAAFVGAGPPTLTWTISGTNARATVSNTGGTAANVTIVIQAIIVGST